MKSLKAAIAALSLIFSPGMVNAFELDHMSIKDVSETIVKIPAVNETAAAANFRNMGPKTPESIKSYLDFLQEQKTDPVEYFVNLFDKYDIVVFAEQLHPEMNQYEFLTKVIAHPKFAAKVGGVFTEIGSISLQPVMDEFLNKKTMDEQLLVSILHEMTFHPQGWLNENIFLFWKAAWKINSKLGKDGKIQAYLSDMPWDWQAIQTSRDYEEMLKTSEHRDKIMADNVIKTIQEYKGGKKKFLVIMNTRHALGLAKSVNGGGYGKNTGTYLKLKWPDKVCNILYHQSIAWPDTHSNPDNPVKRYNPIKHGIWDAAFYRNGNKTAAFDLKNSPFGLDAFDYHSAFTADNYQSVFDGLVFYKPVYENEISQHIPGFYADPAYVQETKRRAEVAGREWMDLLNMGDALKRRPMYTDESKTGIIQFLMQIIGRGKYTPKSLPPKI